MTIWAQASARDMNIFHVGSLSIVTGNNVSAAAIRHAVSRSFRLLDDWLLIYRRDGDAADGSAASRLRLQSYSRVISEQLLAGQLMMIHLPRRLFEGLEDRLDAICEGLSEFQPGPILEAYLETLWRNLPEMRESEQKIVEAVTTQIVRASILRTAEPGTSPSSQVRRSRLEQARRYIDERLTSEHLTVEGVQASLGISRRQLYALFEPYGGVAHYILRQRLRKLRAFASQLPDVPLGSLAERFGIDQARVQSLFRKEFGYDPQDARAASQDMKAAWHDVGIQR